MHTFHKPKPETADTRAHSKPGCRHATLNSQAVVCTFCVQLVRMANDLAAPMIAAAEAEKQRQEERRAAVEAVSPRRRSK